MPSMTGAQWRASGMQKVEIDSQKCFEYHIKANVPLTFQSVGAIKPPTPSPKRTKCKCETKNKPPRAPVPETVYLNIFDKAAKIWHEDYANKELNFRMWKMDVTATPADVIEKVVSKNRSGSLRGWAVTEVIKSGDGEWLKGSTIAYASDQADGELKDYGWTSARSKELPPVWLCVHKK